MLCKVYLSVRFTDLDDLSFAMVVWFRLEPNLNTAPGGSKKILASKVVKNDSKLIISLS